jgi:hypothetical protein
VVTDVTDAHAQPAPAPAAPPARAAGSGWAWFFAGTTLALAVALAALLWALAATGLYPQLIARLGPGARALVQPPDALARVAATPAPIASGARPPEAAPTAPPVGAAPPGGGAPPPAPATPPAAATPAAAAAPPPARPAASAPDRTVRIGEVVASGGWKMLVNGVKSEGVASGRRVTVDFTVKNDVERAASLAIPATIPAAARARPASTDGAEPARLRPVQLAEPPALRLDVLDRAERSFGGGFVSANGQTSGSYTFEAAPGDAIRLTYAFELPADAADPLALDASFGVEAGGQRARVSLGDRASAPATLAPSDPPRSAGKDERLEIAGLWALTVLGLDVGGPGADGQRTVTARLKMDNLSDQVLAAGGTLDDPTGGSRDFYAVDARGQLAYSGSDTMPRTTVPPRQSRTVDVRMRATGEFATGGPYRLSVVVDARRDRYAVFKLP